jgi:MFS family permease
VQAVPARGWRAVPRPVWALGFVSLLMDVSSEMIHALLPVFLVSTLGAGASLVGLIEGIAEGTASILKVFSGAISDAIGKRKRLALIGYGLGAASKPAFALALTPYHVLAARFADRVGKGIRGAPRDALVADVTPPDVRGAAFGLRQTLDTIGAFLGPLLAIALLAALSGNVRAVFALATLPGALAVAVLWLAVVEPPRAAAAGPGGGGARAALPRWSEIRTLGRAFWIVASLGAVFTLARFSEAFLILRAQQAGLPITLVPAVLIVMNVVYSIAATPAGSLSDRIDRRLVLAAGLVTLVAADLVLAGFGNVAGALAGAALWGLHMGLSQGLLAALVADTAPERLRGTAFGLFNLGTGVATFLASLLAGLLWDHVGPGATFVAGAALAGAALAGLLVLIWTVPSGAARSR